MSDKDSKCNRRGRTIKKPEKYCTTDSDKPPSKKKAKSNILQEMTAMFSNSNSEESTDARSQSSDNEYNFSTDSENNVEMKKGSQKAAQSVRKEERNQNKPIAKPDRKKEGNQEKTIQPTSEQQLRHHGNNNLNLSGCSAQTLQNNYNQGTLQPTLEQQLRHHGNNNLNLPGCLTQTLQNNYDQGDDVMHTSNNHSVYDFNSGSVVETSTVQNNSSRTCNKYISPTVTSNNRFYDSSSTSSMYANAAGVPLTYTQGLYVSGTALDNTHIHPQLYNYRNNNDGHINYNDSENTILNNLRSSQESFLQKCEEKMHMFCKTQEQYVSKKVDDMQSYYEKKMDELKTYFNTKLDNLQI